MVKFLAQWLPRSGEIALDGWVLAFTLGISLLTWICCGLLPALHMRRLNLESGAEAGLGAGGSADSGGSRTRNVLWFRKSRFR